MLSKSSLRLIQIYDNKDWVSFACNSSSSSSYAFPSKYKPINKPYDIDYK